MLPFQFSRITGFYGQTRRGWPEATMRHLQIDDEQRHQNQQTQPQKGHGTPSDLIRMQVNQGPDE